MTLKTLGAVAAASAGIVLAGCAADRPPPEAARCPSPEPVVLAAQERRAPEVATAPDGSAVAVWETATGDPLESSGRTGAGAWDPVVRVGERHAFRPRIAALVDGAAVAVWNGSSGGGTVARLAERSTARAWGAPRDLGVPTDRGAWDPEVAADGAGGVVAAWTRAGAGVWLATRTPAGAWAPPRDTGWAEGRVDLLSVDGDGGVVAVAWVERGGVRVAVRGRSGRWGAPERVSPPGGEAGDPDVEVSPAGGAMVVWRAEGSRSRQRVFAARRAGAGRWDVTVLEIGLRGRGIPRPPGPTSIPPRLSVGPDGAAAVVWSRRESRRDRAMIRTFDGRTWAPARALSDSDGSSGPDVLVDAATTVAWEDLDGVRLRLRADRLGAGAFTEPGRPGEEVALPRLAPLPGGGALLIWVGSNQGSIEVSEVPRCA